MGFTQENRFNAPKPEIQDTDYGARYVKAGTETPIGEMSPTKDNNIMVDPVPVANESEVTTVELNGNASDLQNDAELLKEKAEEQDVDITRVETSGVNTPNTENESDEKTVQPRKKARRPKKNNKRK